MIYVWTRPSRPAWVAVLMIALGMRVACLRLGNLGKYCGVWWISWGAFLGLASLLVLLAQIVQSRRLPDDRRKMLRQTFYAGTVFPACSLLIGNAVMWTIWLRPRTYDAFLLAFDGSLGFQPSFVLGRFLPWGSSYWCATTIAYYALPFVVSIVYASHLASERAGKRQGVSILALFLSLMVVGVALYVIYPAVGPKHAFAELYPQNPPSLAQIAAYPMNVPNDPRNSMPSLHLAGALAVWWNSRLWSRWGRVLAALFLCATIFSTLALGEHYLVDLVVAVPFTLALQAAWTISVPLMKSDRLQPLLAGTVITLSWIALLRYGLGLLLISSVLSWGLLFITISWCVFVEQRLNRIASKSTYMTT